jgi:uncharacterized protein
MGKRMCWLLLVSILFISAACTGPSAAVLTEQQALQYAEAFMDHMSAEEYDRAREFFDPNLTQALTREKMRENWQKLVNQHGIFIRLKDTRVEEYSDYYIAYVTCLFQKQVIEAKIILNKQAQITAIFYTPVSRLPDVAATEFQEVEIVITSGEFSLPGIVTLPAEGSDFPGIIFVHNSVAKDRDGTLGPNKVFRDLAWELAAQGIASLRYDKRSLVNPEYFVNNYEYTAQEDTIDDALAAVEFLRNYEGIDNSLLILLGHGLGGKLSTSMVTTDINIDGLILMAALGRSVEDALLDQYEYLLDLTSSPTKEEEALLTGARQGIETLYSIYRGEKGKTKALILGAPVSYWLYLHDFTTEEYIQMNPEISVLVLQGGRDFQVTRDDYRIWQTLFKDRDAEFHYYDTLNHLFMPGEGNITPAEYLKPNNVSQLVVDDIAAWVKQLAQKEGL